MIVKCENFRPLEPWISMNINENTFSAKNKLTQKFISKIRDYSFNSMYKALDIHFPFYASILLQSVVSIQWEVIYECILFILS